MKLSRKIELAVIIGVIFSVVLNIAAFAVTCENVRQEVLRLHVIAASDSYEDQQLKLKVRDAVLQAGADAFDGSVNVENAVERLTPQIDNLELVAKETVRENGFDYDVKVTLSKEFFATRTYENVTLPAGKYLAVRVVIDKGEGQNWWCVMFPSLCLPAARVKTELDDVLNEKEVQLVSRNPKYEPRFKIVEIIEKYFKY
ncbi:MAG: stage II sporulation protein R [Clostridia bacterium]|nr:stage II sporulation protein R [Clostridia bacterium]